MSLISFSRRNAAVTLGLGLLVFSLTLVVGCGGKSVQRIDTDTTVDLSGSWNDTDSRLVSEEMISQVLAHPWLVRYEAFPQRFAQFATGYRSLFSDAPLVMDSWTRITFEDKAIG